MADQRTLMAVCGNMEQIAGVRRIEFQDGRASGLRCALVENGPVEMSLMIDKCLDPAWIRYKGINLSLLTKPGLQGRNPYDTAGDEAVRSIMGDVYLRSRERPRKPRGGRCGISDAWENADDSGREGVHGRILGERNV